jgi:hypothetical protein
MKNFFEAATTSTPKPFAGASPLAERNKNVLRSIPLADTEEEDVKIRTDKFKSKENRPRKGRFNNAQKTRNFAEEKRRNQAIEAMKIAEQRRLRLSSDEEQLAEGMANMSIRDQILPDGRLKLSRKQLDARKNKRRRIEQALAEQRARKYYEATTKKPKKSVPFKVPPTSDTPRPNFKRNAHINPFQYPKKLVPVNSGRPTTSAFAAAAAAEEEKKMEKSIIAEEEVVDAKITPSIIRYTKDELRELNPLGYYFM